MSTKTLVHSSPQGALQIVGVPGDIEPGEPFTVDSEIAERLLAQSDLYRVATKAEIKKHADRQKAAETESSDGSTA